MTPIASSLSSPSAKRSARGGTPMRPASHDGVVTCCQSSASVLSRHSDHSPPIRCDSTGTCFVTGARKVASRPATVLTRPLYSLTQSEQAVSRMSSSARGGIGSDW